MQNFVVLNKQKTPANEPESVYLNYGSLFNYC